MYAATAIIFFVVAVTTAPDWGRTHWSIRLFVCGIAILLGYGIAHIPEASPPESFGSLGGQSFGGNLEWH